MVSTKMRISLNCGRCVLNYCLESSVWREHRTHVLLRLRSAQIPAASLPHHCSPTHIACQTSFDAILSLTTYTSLLILNTLLIKTAAVAPISAKVLTPIRHFSPLDQATSN